MVLYSKIKIKFIHNLTFARKKKKRKILNIKILIYFLLLISKVFNFKYLLKYKKKQYNKFTILKAPYKNKTAQRSYFISRYFFFLELNFEDFYFFDLSFLKTLNQLGSIFFYVNLVQLRTLV